MTMIRLTFGHLCDYATLGANAKLIIVGVWDAVFDRLKARPIPLPPGFIVAKLECSLSDGSLHTVQLALIDADHRQVLQPSTIGQVPFAPSGPGRPLHAQFLIQTQGLAVPDLGDYAVEILVDGLSVGEIPFYVAEPPST